MKPIITSDGFFAYRTRCMEYEQAESFALCLKANRSRFTSIGVELSPRAKGQRAWFVTFQPVNPDRMADIGDREQAARIQRADREGADYIFVIDTHSPRPFYRCFNPKSGETYELDHSTCDCPDHVYRLNKVSGFGIRCKHAVELQRRIDASEILPLREVQTPRLYAEVRYCPADAARIPASR